MKRLKRMVIALIMVFALVSPVILPIASNAVVVEAATIKINKKSLTLEIGKTVLLAMNGTKSKVTWSSSDKKVATVTSKGKVTAVTAGTAKITAKVGTKKYTCTVKVTVPENPYLTDAGFDAVEVAIDKLNLVVPSDWSFNVQTLDKNNFQAVLESTDLISSIIYVAVKNSQAAFTYEEVKAYYQSVMTQEFIERKFVEAGVLDAVISEFTSYDYVSPTATAYVTSYKVTLNGTVMNQKVYDFSLDNYMVEVTTTDAADIDLASLAEYTIDSIRTIK